MRADLPIALARRLAGGRLWGFNCGLPNPVLVASCRPTDTADHAAVGEYEAALADLLGVGRATTFASGRMGFFALMRSLGIGDGDEVILPGFTCAVMPNAVLRTRAKPVYADISAANFGSTAEAIAAVMTPRTRMIVAQHSFGYPCDIKPIVELAKDQGLFLLEDCATSLGSKRDGQLVGTFGDAALFSTDHTKPLVTHIGGFVYSTRDDVVEGLRRIQVASGQISRHRQAAMWQRMAIEARQRTSRGQLKLFLRDLATGITGSDSSSAAFLTKDFRADVDDGDYPYPAQMPSFLASVGLSQVDTWPDLAERRCRALDTLIKALAGTSSAQHLPEVLSDPSCSIVPLRLAWSEPDGDYVRRKLRTRVTTEATWFRSPISVAIDPAEAYGYTPGSCPVSERVGTGMVNLPIPEDPEESERLAKYVRKQLLA